MSTQDSARDSLRAALLEVGSALKQTDLPFALTGGYAAWVHGAPEPLHDVDFLVRPDDAEAVAAALEERGLQVLRPAEDWLFKVNTQGVVVDVIHRGNDLEPDGLIERAGPATVLSLVLPVLSPDDLLVERLLALTEQYCDYSDVLGCMRALREQLHWDELETRVAGHPFAEAALFLAERLGLRQALRPGGQPSSATRSG
jgi:hypothetical protein